MKKIWLLLVLFNVLTVAEAQKVLILENLSIGKSYKFTVGDGIAVVTKNNPKKLSGSISAIDDTSVVIANAYDVHLHDIKGVYVNRRGVQIVSTLLMGFGAMFFTLDVVNNVINNDHPTFKSNTAIIATSSAAAGGILWLFSTRKCWIEKYKWKIKIIDLTNNKAQ